MKSNNLWVRLKTTDWIDIFYSALIAVIVAAMAVGVYARFVADNRVDPWTALTFQAPVEIIDPSGTRPSVEERPDLSEPAIRDDGAVPLRIVRIMDCLSFSCPSGGIPIVATVTWQEVNPNGAVGFSADQVTDFTTNYIEGEDYIVGQLSSKVIVPQALPLPDAVRGHVLSQGKEVSTWRIDGVSTAQIEGAAPSVWSTEVFHLYYPAISTQEESVEGLSVAPEVEG